MMGKLVGFTLMIYFLNSSIIIPIPICYQLILTITGSDRMCESMCQTIVFFDTRLRLCASHWYHHNDLSTCPHQSTRHFGFNLISLRSGALHLISWRLVVHAIPLLELSFLKLTMIPTPGNWDSLSKIYC